MAWMRANREGFSDKRKGAQVKAIEKHFSEERAAKTRRA